ncbi:MAG TPA: DUF1345 domain-containing protein [Sphingomicrobium sp.]|jgi:uncharacterized membrane protein|nr:DUF1345 domain-containing protein [Sphingomicrobium sp.]
MAHQRTFINRIAPTHFITFLAILLVAGTGFVLAIGLERGVMVGFDLAAFVFLMSCIPIFRHDAKRMRETAARDDANRVLLLAVSAILSLVIMVTIVVLLSDRNQLNLLDKLLIVLTLIAVWVFGNAVYTLHYAHLFYSSGKAGKDCAGLDFPGTKEPTLADFAYFAFTLGVAVQTSDVEITEPAFRNVVTAHCVIGFFFNLGVLALTINVLGSG